MNSTTFALPEIASTQLIDFLDSLDTHEDIKHIRDEAFKRLNLSAGDKVLDAGCGIGAAALHIADLAPQMGLIAGIDQSAALLDVAAARSNRHVGIEYRVGDIYSMPYPDQFFDAARSERVFLYLGDRLAAIHEMKRVVKPGGSVCIIDTDIDSTAIFSGKRELTRKMTSILAATFPNPNSGRELPSLVKQAGLRDVKTTTIAFTTSHDFMLQPLLSRLSTAVTNGLTTPAEKDEWLADLSNSQKNGDFFQAWFCVICSGIV